MHTTRTSTIERLLVALRQSLDGRDALLLVDALRAECDRAQQEAHAFGLGEGFARGHEVGWTEGFEVGQREGRADAAHQLSMRFVDAAVALMKGDKPPLPDIEAAESDQLVQLASLENHIREGKAPVH